MICECNGHGRIIEIFIRPDEKLPIGQLGSWPCIECNSKGTIKNVSGISIRRRKKPDSVDLDKNVG